MIDTAALSQLTQQANAFSAQLKELQDLRTQFLAPQPISPFHLAIQVVKCSLTRPSPGADTNGVPQSGSQAIRLSFDFQNDPQPQSLSDLADQEAVKQAAIRQIDNQILQLTHRLRATEDSMRIVTGGSVAARISAIKLVETILTPKDVAVIPADCQVQVIHPLVSSAEILSINTRFGDAREAQTDVNVKVHFICPLDAETIRDMQLQGALKLVVSLAERINPSIKPTLS